MVFNNLLLILSSYRVHVTTGSGDQTKDQASGPQGGSRWETDDLKSAVFWRAVVAEFVALVLFIPLAPGSSVPWQGRDEPSNTQIALANGLAIATLIQCFSHVSGAQFNPAVTIPLAVTREISLARAICYVVAQCLGSSAGAAILRFVTPEEYKQPDRIGLTLLADDVTIWQGFVVEFVITFHLVLMVFATIDPNRKDVKGSAAVAIGFAVATGLLYAIPYTGASMNPARSFGPALVAGNWTQHWIYWAAPIAAGLTAAFVYKLIFAENATILRATSCGDCQTESATDDTMRNGRSSGADHPSNTQVTTV